MLVILVLGMDMYWFVLLDIDGRMFLLVTLFLGRGMYAPCILAGLCCLEREVSDCFTFLCISELVLCSWTDVVLTWVFLLKICNGGSMEDWLGFTVSVGKVDWLGLTLLVEVD